MKRSYPFAVLMALSSPVHAADSISFVVGGHRIRIEAPRHCNSLSCVSVSIPPIHKTRSRRQRYDDGETVAATPPPPIQPPQIQPLQIQPVQVQPPQVRPPPTEPVKIAPPPPPEQQVAVSSIEVVQPVPTAAPQIIKASREAEADRADTPLGDWQTEAKNGTVHIERCGRALCGYVLDPSSSIKGDTVLIDMKPKAPSEWSGNVYSRDSGSTYYGTIAMKGPNSLRVEACAIGKFWCSGDDWSRIDAKTAKLISSRRVSLEPRS